MLCRRFTLLVLLTLACAASTQAQEVGQVDRAEDALGIFAERTWALEANEPVRIGLTLSLPRTRSVVAVGLDVPVSAAGIVRVGSFESRGPKGKLTIVEARWEEPAKKLLFGMKLDRGALWMALGQLVLHQVWIQTPQLKAFPLGTTFRVLVDPIVGTFLATDEGSVRAELNSGETFLVTAGHWLLVPPAGTIQRGPAGDVPPGLEDPPLLDCCDFRTDFFEP
jgi:hypothetical protein